MNYGCYGWFKKWFKLIINDNEQGCIICGENKDLTSRIETSICSDVINTYLYKDSRNLKANMCIVCLKISNVFGRKREKFHRNLIELKQIQQLKSFL